MFANNYLALLLFTSANSQSITIDKICDKIDSLSASFEEFDFSVNYPNFQVGKRIHYIDTLTKQYKKIVLQNEIDSLTKIFYFEKDSLIEVKVLKKVAPELSAKYQFKSDIAFYALDPFKLIKKAEALVPEGRRYFNLVRYKYK